MHHARLRWISLVAGVIAILALVPGTALATPQSAESCEIVSGFATAQAMPTQTGFNVFVTSMTGSLAGMLAGEQVGWMTVEHITPGGTMHVTAVHRFDTEAFGVLTTLDKGTISASGRANMILQITDGGTGMLHLHGTVDPTTGVIELRTQGRLCFE